jgi:hypothetical protein
MNYNDDENWIKYVQIGAFAVLSFIIIGFSFLFPQECNGIDKTSLWCAVHPVTTGKILGVVSLVLGVGAITGVWSWFLGLFGLTKGEYWIYVLLCFGFVALGAILIFA